MNETDKSQDDQIKGIRETLDKKVPWIYMIAFVTLFLTIVGYMFTIASASQMKADNAISRISSVEGDVKNINFKLDIILNYFELTPKQKEQLRQNK